MPLLDDEEEDKCRHPMPPSDDEDEMTVSPLIYCLSDSWLTSAHRSRTIYGDFWCGSVGPPKASGNAFSLGIDCVLGYYEGIGGCMGVLLCI